MSKSKKIVVTKNKLNPTVSKKRNVSGGAAETELTFGRQTYIYMGIGFGLIIIGLLLMSGGEMPSPDVWDEDIIYSFRRITLAPILILAGLIIEIVAIFKK